MLRFFRRILPIVPSPPPLVAMLRLEGAIMREGGPTARTLSMAGVEKALDKAFALPDAKAVALVINSPGGSAVQSRMIHDHIRRLSEEKERGVIVFCEDVAASGGYMIAVAGDEIFADANSIIGSIGAVAAGFGLVDAISRLGVERRVRTAGEHKVRLDPFAPEKPDDVEWLDGMLAKIHEDFIDLVRTRRADKLDAREDLFQGEVWVGRDAYKLGLIDGLGHPNAVLKEKFGDKVRVRMIRPSRGSLTQRFLGAGAEAVIGAIESRLAWARFGL